MSDTKLDETVPVWDYPEKEALFKFYPQYYHKTDKVPQPNPTRRSYSWAFCLYASRRIALTPSRMVVPSTLSRWVAST